MKNVNVAKLQETNAKYQYLAAIVVNLLTVCFGFSCGWTSPSFVVLKSDGTPLASGKISTEEASWIASFSCIGGLVGSVLFGFITSNFGRKIPLLLSGFPSILGWWLIIIAPNIYYIYAARLLGGFVAGGMFVMIPLFLSEIATDNVRGVLGSTLMFNGNIGVLIAFILGNYCDIYAIPKLAIVVSSLFILLFYFFPETPSFLMKQNKQVASATSLCSYAKNSNI